MRIVLATLLVLAASVHAEPALRLSTAGDACSTDAVRARVVELLGRDPFSADARRELAIDLASEDGVAATVVVTELDGTLAGPRTLHAADCAQLESALAIVIAAVVRSLPPERPVVVAPEPAPELFVDRPAPARHRATTIEALAGFGIGARTEGVAGLRVRHGRGSLAIQARHGGAEEVAIAPGESSIAVTSFAFDAVPCAHAGAAFACGILTAGWHGGSAQGLTDLSAARLPLVGVGARIGAEYHLTDHTGIAFHADLRALVTETRFQVDRMTVWTSSRFDGSGGIDLFAQFP